MAVTRLPMRPFDDITRIENATALDRPAAAVRGVVQKLLRDRRLRDFLHGTWLGHPFHPGAAQLTAGALLSASLLDLTPSGPRRSSGLIATGILAALPTVAAGWADWAESHEEQQRVGLVHAAVNVLAVSCYAGALRQRARGGQGRALSLTGGAVAFAGALLGGHLGYRQATGANHAEEIYHVAPGDWTGLGSFNELPEGRPVRRMAGDVPVFVLRRAGEVTVLSDRCPHLSAPLSDGELDTEAGELVIHCPWHDSVFRVADGSLVHGPATAPVPVFDARVTQGTVEAKIRTIPGVAAA